MANAEIRTKAQWSTKNAQYVQQMLMATPRH
jgi:hypothetical protein